MSVKRDISNLPKGAQLCFRQWYEGGDVRAMYSVRTFYRYRKFIFEELKIDISCAATEQDTKLEHIKNEIVFPASYQPRWCNVRRKRKNRGCVMVVNGSDPCHGT